MRRSMIYVLGLLFILCACEKVTLESEVMTLDDEFITAEIDGEMVRFDGFRFGRDDSYYRVADPARGNPAELRITRTTSDGLEEITLVVMNFDLSGITSPRSIPVGRAEDQQATADTPELSVQLVSSEVSSGSSHCPALGSHLYELEGTLFIESWSPETGRLQARFEAEQVGLGLNGFETGGVGLYRIRDQIQERRFLSNGFFDVRVQQLR